MGDETRPDEIIKKLELEVVQARQQAAELKKERKELAVILGKIPLFILVVDSERRVRKISDAVLRFTGRTRDEVIGMRGGEALRCVHHLDDPKGCGYGPECSSCRIRSIVQDTLTTGESYDKADAELSFMNDPDDRRSLLVSTTSIENPDPQVLIFVEDITERRRAEAEREQLIHQLQEALSEVNKLSGMLPICASCKRIRDDMGYWNRLEAFIQAHSEARFSHSVCPACVRELYPDYAADEPGEVRGCRSNKD
jgi:PAS domain-containing protein